MSNKITFGQFITLKRQQENVSMRTLSKKIDVSASFFSKMENGKRPAPSGKTQEIIARALNLTEEECIQFFDLAAETKRDGTLPHDISDYINNDKDMIVFLREVIRYRIKGADLMKLI